MCLSIEGQRPADVLAKGMHLGYEWMVVHNGMGHRCGYVRVPKTHPWYGKDYDDVGAEVHGGLTFGRADVPCGKAEDGGYWFGFDCAHAQDAPDPDLATPTAFAYPLHGSVVRTQEYVERECRNLCEQAELAAVAMGLHQDQAMPSLRSWRGWKE